MAFADLSRGFLTRSVLLSPVDAGEVGAPPKEEDEDKKTGKFCPKPSSVGLPHVNIADAQNCSQFAPANVKAAKLMEGHFRFLGIEGASTECKRILVVYIRAFLEPVDDVCGLETFRLIVPSGLDLPFVELKFGRSLLTEDFSTLGVSVSGDVDVSGGYDPLAKRVTIYIEASGKAKSNGTTVASGSGSIEVSKDLSDLTPCADYTAKFARVLRAKGECCYDPVNNNISVTGTLAILAFGDWHDIATYNINIPV